jgi:multidrug resistance efflux pump
MVQPDDPVNAQGVTQSGMIKSAAMGRVVKVLAQDGELVTAGQPILILDDPEVRRDLAFRTAEIKETEAKMRQDRVQDQTQFLEDSRDLDTWQQMLKDTQRRQEDLTIKAPFTGRLVAPNLHNLPDTIITRGQEIARVAVLDRLVIKGDIDQKDRELISSLNSKKIEVRFAGTLGKSVSVPNDSITVLPSAMPDLVDRSLGSAGGGDIPIDPHDPTGLKAEVSTFEAWVKFDNSEREYYPGQRAYVRLTLSPQSLAWQWRNKFLQLLESRGSGRWL